LPGFASAFDEEPDQSFRRGGKILKEGCDEGAGALHVEDDDGGSPGFDNGLDEAGLSPGSRAKNRPA
jgi:hypothetical protein